MQMNYKKLLCITMVSLALMACTKPKTGESTLGGGTDGQAGLYAQGGANSNGYQSSYYDPQYGQRGTIDRVIYFDYDSDSLRSESNNVVMAHSQQLVSNPNQGIILEGHTDERGSREYNIGLGERRANSVRQLMIASGVNPAQIRVVSYGKERPAVGGSDEGAWAQNRRVEIVY